MNTRTMNHINLIIVFFFLSHSCFAQKILDHKIAEIDSLTRVRAGAQASAALGELRRELKSKPDSERKILYYQYYSLLEAENGNHAKFKLYLDSALLIVDQIHNGVHSKVPELYTQGANTLAFIDIEMFSQYLNNLREYLDKNQSSDGEANYLRLKGIHEALNGKLYAAIYHYEESLEHGGFYNSKYEAETYINLDYFYTHTNQTDLAKKCKIKTLDVLSKQNPKNNMLMSQLYQTLAMAENAKGTIPGSQTAIKYANISIKHAEDINNYDLILTAMLEKLAAQMQIAMLDKRGRGIDNSIQIVEAIIDLEEEAIALKTPLQWNFKQISHSLLADFLIRVDKSSLAEKYNAISKSELKTTDKKYQKYVANYLWRKGMIESKKGNSDVAIQIFQEAICAMNPQKIKCDDVHSVPIFDDLNQEWNAKICESKANAYIDIYQKNQDEKFLEYARQSFMLYDSVMTDFYQKNNSTIDRVSEMNTGTHVYGAQYENSGVKSDFYQALLYAEKFKNIVIVKGLLTNHFKNNYPAEDSRNLSRLKEAYEIQKGITEKLLLSSDSLAEQSTLVLNAQEKVYRDFQSELEHQYPTTNTDLLEEVFNEEYLKSYLENAKHESIIEYQFAGNQLIILVYNESHQNIKIVDVRADELKKDVVKLRQYLESRNSVDSLNKYSRKLYSILIEPIKNDIKYDQLLIIADDFLSYIPFGILMNEAEQYLIESKTIRYAKTIIFQQIMQNNSTHENNEELLAIAASPEMKTYASLRSDTIRSGLGKLPGAIAEINTLSNIVKGKFLSEEQASETFFKKNCKHYSAIHLAMHGVIDEDVPAQSRLIFSQEDNDQEGYLYASEIQNLQLNADLVTLSACHSGYGNNLSGQGISSLSSAFALAGVPNSIASLWAVHDQSSAIIMDELYKKLQSGEMKHHALRNAKLAYIESQPEILKHPYYWSGFVYYGDDQPIVLNAKSPISSNLKWIFGGIAIVILFLMIKSKRVRAT